MSRLDDLLLELMDRPTDDDYLVYADAASMAGDPRGELIAIQHALANHLLDDHRRSELRARELALLEHHDALWGEGMRNTFHAGIEWHNGFVRSARVDSCSEGTRTIDHSYEVDEALDLLLAHPSSLLLEDLVLATSRAEGPGDATPRDRTTAFGYRELALVDEYRPYRLRRLTFNDRWVESAGLPNDPSCYDISWYKLAGMAALSRGAPDLAELTLYAGDFVDLEELELPRLRSLALRSGGLRRSRLAALLDRVRPSVERLELWFGRAQYGADVDVPDLRPILDGTAFPNLRWLGLMNAEFTDELCAELHRARILPQLEGLSLAMGCLSSNGAPHVIAHSDAYRRLRELDLSKQFLDDRSLESLGRVLPQARLTAQRGNRHYRYAMIGE